MKPVADEIDKNLDTNSTIIKDHFQVDKILRGFVGKRVALTTHENPDGDGLCCAMALSFGLKYIYKAEPTIIMDSASPTFLNGLPFSQCNVMSLNAYKDSDKGNFDLLIVLDCHEEDRVDTDKEIFQMVDGVLIIDHHEVNTNGTESIFHYDNSVVYSYIDSSAVSTGVIINRFLYQLVKDLNPSWKNDYANCIYTTILNDTDNFFNANTNKETFQTVADLYDFGLKPNIVVNQFMYRKSIYYYRFIGNVLSTIEVKNKIAIYYSTLQMLKNNYQTTDAYSKITKWTKGTYDVDIQVLFQEYGEGFFRVSLRSDLHDVAEIAQHYGGGGHKKAAGMKINGKLSEVKNELISFIESKIL